ncbi:MAG: HEAT repeat domain-containing protein [Terracidiphilus sp.]
MKIFDIAKMVLRLSLSAAVLLPTARLNAVAQSATEPQASAVDAAAQLKVAEVMKRALARDYSVVDGWNQNHEPVKGVTRISWVPPTAEDYSDIGKLGESAVSVLATYVKPEVKPGGLIQLLAVKFLASIGTASTIEPLGRALDPANWQVARMSALDVLGSMKEPEALAMVRTMLKDGDPVISGRARGILVARHQE